MVCSSPTLPSRERPFGVPFNVPFGVLQQLRLALPASSARICSGRGDLWPPSDDGLRSPFARGLGGRNDTRRSHGDTRPARTNEAAMMLAGP